MGFQSNDGQDRRVRLINATSVTMSYSCASNPDAWLYDFRASFADGDTLERYRVNVCQITGYRYTAG